jgi:uncharacterized membrane protein required for colicin V production
MSNYLDVALCLVIIVLGLSSAFRGFIKEFVSMVVLIFAITISYYSGSILQPILLNIIKYSVISGFLAYSISFLFSLFAGNKLFANLFIDMEFNKGLDMIFGFAFGFVKAIIFIFLFFMVVDYIIAPYNQPYSIKNSQIKLYIYELKGIILDNHKVN